MTFEQVRDRKPGTEPYRWVSVGNAPGHGGSRDSHEIQVLFVVRVNRKTITVRTREGSTFRIDPSHLDGTMVPC